MQNIIQFEGFLVLVGISLLWNLCSLKKDGFTLSVAERDGEEELL